MAVGLDDIQTELADLDIEVDAYPYQIARCRSNQILGFFPTETIIIRVSGTLIYMTFMRA